MLEVITVWFLMTAGGVDMAVAWMPTTFQSKEQCEATAKQVREAGGYKEVSCVSGPKP